MKNLAILLLVLSVIASCTGESEEPAVEEQVADTRGEPVQMIPDEEFSELEKRANAFIRPYFDDQATQTEKTVKVGDVFDLYVFAEYSEEYPMCGAEYKLTVPEGVVVLSQVQTDSLMLSRGTWDNDFMIVFHCTPGPKMWLAKYVCKAEEGSQSGVFETHQGADLLYLGFTMCDRQRTMVKARSGKAALTVQ
jgi:hypothetical protein